MIVTCPSCASRYEFSNALQAPGDVKITCRSCGHRWIELDAADIIDVKPFRRAGLRSEDIDDLPDDDIERLMRASREAKLVFDERRNERRKSIVGWLGYAAFTAVPFLVALTMPETVVATAPVTFKAYQTVGYDINIYGLEIRRVAQDHKIIKGERVLTIKGDVVNITNEIKQIPSMRFALRNSDGSEVYHWILDTASRPLCPGEVTGFVTRVQEPPAGAKDLQIRFAKEADIQTASTTPLQ
jgi:predicted Zn finger-like uncharacterized protein